MEDTVMSIKQVMAQDHKRCDDAFVQAEYHASKKEWPQTIELIKKFRDMTLYHFSHEEKTLFPAFESATGMTQGPTMMMRSEHEQMRDLLDQLVNAAEQQDKDEFLGTCETFHIFNQQHNMKEEQVLYPMIDQHCGQDSKQLLQNIIQNIDSNAA